MNACCFFSRLPYSLIPRPAAVTLVAFAWSSLAFCGAIRDTARSGDPSQIRIPTIPSGGIHEAAGDGNLTKVKALLKDNPDLVFSKDDQGCTPLHWAANKGYKDVAELLLARHADVNANNNYRQTPLHAAALVGHGDVVELLLAKGAEVNARDYRGTTPLHDAAGMGQKEVAELLLARGAEVNAKDDDGATPLHVAAGRGHEDVAELLRQHGGHE